MQITLPHPGRFVVTLRTDGHLHLHETGQLVSLDEGDVRNARTLAHAMKLVEGLWHETLQLRSVGLDPERSYALVSLENAILEGGRLASRLIWREYEELREQYRRKAH